MVAECKRQGVPPPAVCQPYYNLLNRLPEVEILPACGFHGLGVAPYSPIARGVLTGKYKPGDEPPRDSRAALIAASCRPVAAGIAGDCAKLEGGTPRLKASRWCSSPPPGCWPTASSPA